MGKGKTFCYRNINYFCVHHFKPEQNEQNIVYDFKLNYGAI